MKGVLTKLQIGAYEIEVKKIEGRLEGSSLVLDCAIKSRGEFLEIHWDRDEFVKLKCTEPMDIDFETFFCVMPDQWVEMVATHYVYTNFGKAALDSFVEIGCEINQDGQLQGFDRD